MLFVMVSQQVIKPPEAKDVVRTQLPLTTHPLMAPKALHPTDIVGVDQVLLKESGEEGKIFRYNFRAEAPQLLKRLMAELPEKEGWRARQTGVDRYIVERVVKSGPLYSQALVIWPYKMVRDAKVHVGWRALPPEKSKGWVFVSYQETKLPKQPPSLGKPGKG